MIGALGAKSYKLLKVEKYIFRWSKIDVKIINCKKASTRKKNLIGFDFFFSLKNTKLCWFQLIYIVSNFESGYLSNSRQDSALKMVWMIVREHEEVKATNNLKISIATQQIICE